MLRGGETKFSSLDVGQGPVLRELLTYAKNVLGPKGPRTFSVTIEVRRETGSLALRLTEGERIILPLPFPRLRVASCHLPHRQR